MSVSLVDEIAKRASHGAVVIGNWMWVVGGYSLNKYDMKNDFIARLVNTCTIHVLCRF